MPTVKKFIPSFLALLLLLLPVIIPSAEAADTTPSTMNYQGRLLDSGNQALQGNYTFRFSLWKSADKLAGDVDGGGNINAGAANYAGWQETQNATTDAFGLFNLDVGSSTPLPDFAGDTHKYLQVEVKTAGSPDTSYEVLDPDGTDNTNDRKPIQNQPFSRTADTLDNIIDANQSGNTIELIFGDVLLNAIMSYDPNGVGAGDGWFNFNDDVNIQGNLTVTGTVNGVNLSTLSAPPVFVGNTTATTDGSFSSGGKIGYEAANDLCNAEFAGSHICTSDDIIYTIASQNIAALFAGEVQGWVAEGAPGYTANANDCSGWTSNAATNYYGAYWVYDTNGGGKSWLSPCAPVKPVSCCR